MENIFEFISKLSEKLQVQYKDYPYSPHTDS